MGAPPNLQTPPLPPGIKAQQGPMAGPGAQPGMTENAEAIMSRIAADVRKLARSLVNAKPEALQTLKEILPMLSQLQSEIVGTNEQESNPAPPPTPGETLPPPTASAAPAGGYLPGA